MFSRRIDVLNDKLFVHKVLMETSCGSKPVLIQNVVTIKLSQTESKKIFLFDWKSQRRNNPGRSMPLL